MKLLSFIICHYDAVHMTARCPWKPCLRFVCDDYAAYYYAFTLFMSILFLPFRWYSSLSMLLLLHTLLSDATLFIRSALLVHVHYRHLMFEAMRRKPCCPDVCLFFERKPWSINRCPYFSFMFCYAESWTFSCDAIIIRRWSFAIIYYVITRSAADAIFTPIFRLRPLRHYSLITCPIIITIIIHAFCPALFYYYYFIIAAVYYPPLSSTLSLLLIIFAVHADIDVHPLLLCPKPLRLHG